MRIQEVMLEFDPDPVHPDDFTRADKIAAHILNSWDDPFRKHTAAELRRCLKEKTVGGDSAGIECNG